MAPFDRLRISNPFSCNEVIQKGPLRIIYEGRLKKAPYKIAIYPDFLLPLLSHVSYGELSFGDFSSATIRIDAKGGKKNDQIPLANMISKEPYDPLAIAIHGGSIYSKYLDLIQNGLKKDSAIELIKKNLSVTIVHELMHYIFRKSSAVYNLLLITHSKQLSVVTQALTRQGFSGDEEEFACEAFAHLIVGEDGRWFDCNDYSVDN